MGCKTIRSLEISSKVGEIKKSAFEQCENLESVTMTNLIVRIEEKVFDGCSMLKQIQIIDMSQQYPAKTQRKIHRNFYNVLRAIRPESAEAYANQYNVSLKSPFWDISFSKQQKNESENYITRLSVGYQNSPFIISMVKLVNEEAKKSERLLPQIELFRDSFIISSVKVGKLTKRKIVYNDFGIGIRELPDINHILACATVLAQALGDDYVLSPEHNKGSAVIRPSIS